MSLSEACGGNDRTLRGSTGLQRPAVIFASLVFLICSIAGAHSQGNALLSSSYITPFPQSDRYQVRVIGDWLGAGLTSGLQDAFKNDVSLQITDMSRSSYGLVRAEQLDLLGEIDRMLAAGPVHIVIFMLGVNDRASLRAGAGRAQPVSAEWKEAYGKEAEKLIKKLRNANVAVYWVGMPVMSNPGFNEFAAGANDAVRQAVYINGAKFIETSVGFTDQLGAYSAWGTDITGQTKRLREGDGVGLTPAGNRKLASFVEIALRRDLAQARTQRNIPLAGDEEEQARVVPPSPRSSSAAKSALAGQAKQEGQAPLLKRPDQAGSKPDAGAKAAGGLKTEGMAPAPAAQDTAQREQAAFAGSGAQQGEFILSDLGNGLTSIAVISPVSDLSIREIQRQTPLADRLYFKVLSKGEALPAKEGRADDFQWRENGAEQSQ
ncbi:MAG: GDSL-type esterase/lipase family protein [Rhodomicrobium sp.]